MSTSEIRNSFWVTTLRQKKSQISNGPPTGPKDVDQNMIKGQSLFKLQALCSHVVFHVRLRPAAQAAALVSDGSPAAPERRHRLQPWLTGVQGRPFLVNWWQMLASFGALTRSSGRLPPFTRRGFQCLWILKQSDCFSLFCIHFRAEVSGNNLFVESPIKFGTGWGWFFLALSRLALLTSNLPPPPLCRWELKRCFWCD